MWLCDRSRRRQFSPQLILSINDSERHAQVNFRVDIMFFPPPTFPFVLMAREVIFPRMELKLPPIEYCPSCGGHVEPIPREGRIRPVCGSCGFVVYVNPYPAACAVVFSGNRILLTKRSIEPKFANGACPDSSNGENPLMKRPVASLKRKPACRRPSRSGRGVFDISVSAAMSLLGYLAREWSGNREPATMHPMWRGTTSNKLPHLAFTAHDQVVADVRGSA